LRGDREVDDRHLDADLREVVGVRELGGDVEPEVVAVRDVGVSQA
jgi:hypothetical protein